MPLLNAYRAPGFAEACGPALAHHIFLIAIRDELGGSLVHRGSPLHPMRVIFTGPGEGLPFAALDTAIGPLPALPAPSRHGFGAHPAGPLVPREVMGDILRDGHGRLYERVGDTVRPVSQLFAGARGEMIDLAPLRVASDAAGTTSAVTPGGAADEASAAHVLEPDVVDDADLPSGAAGRPRALRELARRLVPDPGLWRLVRFADFIDAITPQLADPRRLQPGHQLACYVQIHEVTAALPLAGLEDAAAREFGAAGKLLPLSYDLCRRFALSLPRPTLALAAAQRVYSPGVVPAGARFVTLRVALDPTAETTPVAQVPVTSSPVMSSPAAAAASPAVAPTPEGTACPAAATAAAAPGPPTAGTPRTSIPEEYAKPWELTSSRDEALYDMTLATSRGAWQRLLHRVTDRIPASAMKKWHALLSGRTPDQQLWGVKPPRGALTDARIRRWAQQVLELGGYDVPRMLLEWEIHWRRKGL